MPGYEYGRQRPRWAIAAIERAEAEHGPVIVQKVSDDGAGVYEPVVVTPAQAREAAFQQRVQSARYKDAWRRRRATGGGS